MSKTSKLRRMKSQIEKLEKAKATLEFFNKELMKEQRHFNRPFQRVEPPVIRNNEYFEENQMIVLLEYIYDQLHLAWERAMDDTPSACLNDMDFILYLDRNLLYKLKRIYNYSDLSTDQQGNITFLGYKIVVVENMADVHHCNFVRIA